MNAQPWFAFHMPLYTFPDVPDGALFEYVVELAQKAEQLGYRTTQAMEGEGELLQLIGG